MLSLIYQLVFLGSGSGGAFTLANTTMPTAPELTYSLEFNDEPKPGGTRVRSGYPVSSQVGLHSSSNTTLPNGNISWQIPNSALRDAPGGIYSGTVVVLVAPE